jgi:hypothetical protein
MWWLLSVNDRLFKSSAVINAPLSNVDKPHAVS